jgi:hypothetical protein
MSLTSSRPSRWRRPVITTFAPNSAIRFAVAAPMPLVPPVMSATFLVETAFSLAPLTKITLLVIYASSFAVLTLERINFLFW